MTQGKPPNNEITSDQLKYLTESARKATASKLLIMLADNEGKTVIACSFGYAISDDDSSVKILKTLLLGASAMLNDNYKLVVQCKKTGKQTDL